MAAAIEHAGEAEANDYGHTGDGKVVFVLDQNYGFDGCLFLDDIDPILAVEDFKPQVSTRADGLLREN
jgi:hypothetical protein